MRYFLSLLIFLALLAWLPYNAQAQQASRVHGELGFRVGTTTLPIYPRGEGNNSHYEGEFKLNTTYKRTTFHLGGLLKGGSTFDNPDGFNLTFGLDIKLNKNFSLILEHTDAYALNHNIIRDTQSRVGGSSVNAWWVGVRHTGTVGPIRIATEARHVFAGNEPLFFTHFTRPYALQSLGSTVDIFPNAKIRGQVKNEFFFHSRLNEFRSESSGHLRFFITRHGAIELSARTIRNSNIQNGVVDFRNLPLRNRSGAFVGFVYIF